MSKKGWEAALESGLKLSGESGANRERGWLLVAKWLPSCSDQERRTLRSRVSSRFTTACQSPPSLRSALFIRSSLAVFPAFRDLYKSQFEQFLDALLDKATESSDVLLERATRELWADGASAARITKAADLLRNVVFEFGRESTISRVRAHRGALLLRLLADCVRHAQRGASLPSSLLDTLGTAIDTTEWSAPSLKLLSVIVKYASWAVAPRAKRLCQSLIRMTPSTELYEVLTSLEESLNASSHLHAHLSIVFNSLQHPLPAEYADAASRMLEAVIIRSGSLADPAVLSCICSAVCSSALRYRTPVYGRLVAALLSHGHDLVPVPIHIARSLIRSAPPSEERTRLQMLADAACRPRTYVLAPSLLREEINRVRGEALISNAIKMTNEVHMKEEEEIDEEAAVREDERSRLQMRVPESEKKKKDEVNEKEKRVEEVKEEEVVDVSDDEVEKGNEIVVQPVKEIKIMSKNQKKKEAKKRKQQEAAQAAAAKRQRVPEAAVKPVENKSVKPAVTEIVSTPSKAPETKKNDPPKVIPEPKELPADVQAVIDMAVLDFD